MEAKELGRKKEASSERGRRPSGDEAGGRRKQRIISSVVAIAPGSLTCVGSTSGDFAHPTVTTKRSASSGLMNYADPSRNTLVILQQEPIAAVACIQNGWKMLTASAGANGRA